MAVAYGVAGIPGKLVELAPVRVSPIWPAAGVAVASLLFWGRSLWPGILLGSFALNVGKMVVWTGSLVWGALAALAIAGGATASALVAATLIRRAEVARMPLCTLRGLFAFIGIGAIAAPLINAAIGTATIALAGYVGPESAAAAAVSWWLGDMTGVIVAGPLLLLAAVRYPIGPSRHLDEAVAIFVLLLVGAF